MSWRAELRAEGISTRPPPSADRGHVEQPGERTEPTRRRVVIPMQDIEREQLEALAEELGEPSPFDNTEPPPKEHETTLVPTKPSAFKPPSPPLPESKAENETEEARRRARRKHSEEDKRAAAARVIDGGEYQKDVAADYDVAQGDVCRWVKKERERREMAKGEKKDEKRVYQGWKTKVEAVRRVRALEKEQPGRRGHQATVAREMGLHDSLVSNWCNSGEFEPEPEPEQQQEGKTMMSRPEPQPMSQPMPPPSAPPSSYMQREYAASHMPPMPPAWWSQQPPPALQPSPQMMGLEEYIKKTIEYEVARQVPLAVNAILERLWGKR
jgi:transposase-like protein